VRAVDHLSSGTPLPLTMLLLKAAASVSYGSAATAASLFSIYFILAFNFFI
jgi:hypothetical protein